MKTRPIDANQLYRIEKLLDTDIVKKDKVASELLEQVLYDIQHMPTITPPNEWVSVDDRLPEEDPHIKKFIDGEIFGLLTVLVYNGEVKQTNRFFCNATKFGFSKTDGWEWASRNVTHWMPLPEPPEKEHDHE